MSLKLKDMFAKQTELFFFESIQFLTKLFEHAIISSCETMTIWINTFYAWKGSAMLDVKNLRFSGVQDHLIKKKMVVGSS